MVYLPTFITGRTTFLPGSLFVGLSRALYVGHFGGISIGYCKIGKNCNINQHLQLGTFPELFDPSLRVAIADNVW